MKQLRVVFLFLIIGCQSSNRFSKEALNEKFVSIAQQDVTFQNILLKHQEKKSVEKKAVENRDSMC